MLRKILLMALVCSGLSACNLKYNNVQLKQCEGDMVKTPAYSIGCSHPTYVFRF